jgi:hypothetical protein
MLSVFISSFLQEKIKKKITNAESKFLGFMIAYLLEITQKYEFNYLEIN